MALFFQRKGSYGQLSSELHLNFHYISGGSNQYRPWTNKRQIIDLYGTVYNIPFAYLSLFKNSLDLNDVIWKKHGKFAFLLFLMCQSIWKEHFNMCTSSNNALFCFCLLYFFSYGGFQIEQKTVSEELSITIAIIIKNNNFTGEVLW